MIKIESMNYPQTISCTTFNILAPIYKRLGGGMRESDFSESWLRRNKSILDKLLHLKSSVICLQEFWVGNEELVEMYEKRLTEAGYLTYKLARTNNRGDGLLTAIHQSQFRLINYSELLFNDIGDRVAQVLHVELSGIVSQNGTTNKITEALIINTHLIFPHDSRYCFLRLQQVYKILQYIRSYVEYYSLPVPVILCGDWNGSKKGHVYKFLRSQGFESSYDIARHCEDDTEDSQKWVSHRNHRGNICGVDFIWLQNPRKFHKPLKDSFMEAILGNIKNLLHNGISQGGDQMPAIFKVKGSCITYADFFQALEEVGKLTPTSKRQISLQLLTTNLTALHIRQLGICGHAYGGLDDEDIKKIWKHLDEDGDGIADVPNFLAAWSVCSSSEKEHTKTSVDVREVQSCRTTIGFVVKKAMLFPEEVEKGTWPESYLLSDHAHLSVEFYVKELPYI